MCSDHAQLPLVKRPRDCDGCRDDLEHAYAFEAARCEWLNRWRDDALDVLTRDDAALALLTGFEARQLTRGNETDVVRVDVDGNHQSLVESVTLDQATRLVAFLERVVQVADGTAPVINIEEG